MASTSTICRRVRAGHRSGPNRPDERGFTLVEMVVAVAIISVVMLAVAAVFVGTARGTKLEGARQSASRLLVDGLDRVRALTGVDLVQHRDLTSSATQWNARPADVTKIAGHLAPAYDAAAARGDGAGAPLPTTPVTVVADGLSFTQQFYVARCFQVPDGGCVAAGVTAAVPMYDVVVAVSWPDRACSGGSCTSVASTLVAADLTDPLFNSNKSAVAPAVGALADQTDYSGGTVALPVTVVGGNGASLLTLAGAPDGIALTGAVLGGTLPVVTTSTSYQVTVTATDEFGLIGQTTFTWTVVPPPAVASMTASIAQGGPATVTLRVTGGIGPFTWSAATLPAGLQLDAATGVVTGTPTGASAPPTTVTVADRFGRTASGAISWNVLAITAPTDAATITGDTIVPATAVECSGTCAWSMAMNPPDQTLPIGLTIDPDTGVISFAGVASGTYTTTLAVSDDRNRTAVRTVVWSVS